MRGNTQRRLLAALLRFCSSLAAAGVLNIEFKFSPFIGDPQKFDHVKVQPAGKITSASLSSSANLSPISPPTCHGTISPPVTALTDADRQDQTALDASRAETFKPEFASAYQ